MKRIVLIIALLLFVLSPLAALASDISGAIYRATITTSNNSTATANVSAVFSTNTTAWIDSGYVNSSLTNVALRNASGADIPFMPGYGTNPWVFWLSSIGTNSYQNSILYVGGTTAMAGKRAYFPGTAGMSSAHSTTTDLGSNNYTFEISAFLDGSKTGTYPVLHADGTSGPFYPYFYIKIDAANHIQAVVGTNYAGYGVSTLDAAITSGEYIVKVQRVGGTVSLYLNGVLADSDTAYDVSTSGVTGWTYGANGSTPYINYVSLTIGSTLQQYLTWQYSATFTDGSGNGHDATPSFRTTSSDADVSAAISAFTPLTTAQAPAYTVGSAPSFYSGNITTSGNFTVGNVPTAGPPGSGLVEDAATAGATPNFWLWGILGMFTMAMAGLGLSWLERQTNTGGGGTLLARMTVHIVIMGLLVTWQKFDWWMIVFYVMIAGSIAMMSRHSDWGGSVSQHGLIGFLATSWVGLTVINRVLEGQFLTGVETNWANYFAFTQQFKVFDLFSIPVINFQFFTNGIPTLLNWDYSFFGGNAQLLQYVLYSLTAVVGFMIFVIVIGMLYSAFSSR